MDIRVEYFAQIKTIVGKTDEWISFTGPLTLNHLLRFLHDRKGVDFRSIVFDETGNILPSIMISLNYEQVQWDSAQTLEQGDTVSILSPMSGG